MSATSPFSLTSAPGFEPWTAESFLVTRRLRVDGIISPTMLAALALAVAPVVPVAPATPLPAAVPVPVRAPDDCARCKNGKVCKPHRDAEKAELQRLAPLLASEVEGERIGALSSVAALTDEHENCPSEAVARVLADALDDDRLAVRTHAMSLLSEGQHPETAVKATARVMKEFESGMWTLVADLMGPKGERGSVDDAMRYVETTVRACAGLRDDRIANGLASLLIAFPTEMRGEPVATAATESLLELGTEGAVQAVITTLGDTRDDTAKRRIHMALVRLADARDVEERPSFSGRPEKEWKAWLKKNRRTFPKKLGKWKGPPPEDDDEADDG